MKCEGSLKLRDSFHFLPIYFGPLGDCPSLKTTNPGKEFTSPDLFTIYPNHDPATGLSLIFQVKR